MKVKNTEQNRKELAELIKLGIIDSLEKQDDYIIVKTEKKQLDNKTKNTARNKKHKKQQQVGRARYQIKE